MVEVYKMVCFKTPRPTPQSSVCMPRPTLMNLQSHILKMNYLVILRNLYSCDRYKRASLILIKGIKKNRTFDCFWLPYISLILTVC